MYQVAITGATGMIGRRLVREHLERGDRVRILTRGGRDMPPGVEVCVGDLSQSLPDGFPGTADVLYHCAAELRDPAKMTGTNVQGTRLLAEVAKGKIGRWVQLSSVGVYGSRGEGVITEDTELRPFNAYERSKAASDMQVREYADNGSFDLVILRPSTVFGSGMTNKSLYHLAEAVRRRIFFFVGPQGASANYVHVDNVVAALVLCANHPSARGRVYNLSDWLTIEDFIVGISRVLNAPAPRIRLPLQPVRILAAIAGAIPRSPLTAGRIDALTQRVRYPCDRIVRELGYAPRMSMENGLRELLTPAGHA